MKKILAITGIRSDYDLMAPLFQLLHEDKDIDLQLLVLGAHLSPTFGHSVDNITRDGYNILLKIESLIDSNSSQSRLKSASIALQNSIDIVAQYAPDLIIYAGDREDVMIGALLGGYMEIPTLHFYGGDHVKDSHIDNPIRHAVSKLSTAHFVTLEEHKERLIKMGEAEKRIFVIGNIALDRFKDFQPLSKIEIAERMSVDFQNFALMIFHPIVEEKENAGQYFEMILHSLKEKNIPTFVSYPNVDPGNKNIIDVISKFQEDKNFCFYKNLPRDLFLSIYKNACFIIGNSSSGTIEAASIPIPAINVGIRQTGRRSSKNVLYCKTTKNEVVSTIEKALSSDFLMEIMGLKNIYGNGDSALKAYEIIKDNNFIDWLFKNEDALDS